MPAERQPGGPVEEADRVCRRACPMPHIALRAAPALSASSTGAGTIECEKWGLALHMALFSGLSHPCAPLTSESAMTSLLDQSALVALAERLVEAARRSGADAADAMAIRSVSLGVEVRDGHVEETERAESDDLGLRVFVGRRQAVISTNDIHGDGFDALAERAVAMARVAPEDPYAGLAEPGELARQIPDLDLLDPDMPSVQRLEDLAVAAETAALSIGGVTKSGGASASSGIGGIVLVTSHGFHGAYLGSTHSVSAMAIAGEGLGMERDYDFSS